MAESDEPDPRVAELERQVRELDRRVRSSAQDAAAARILAGGADRDVAEIRGEIRDFRQATTSSFNAMRADFTDLRREYIELQQRVDNGFAEMRGRFDATAAGQQHIVDLLTTIMNEQGGDT
jgi:chromosome segregation ATPase